MARLPTVGGDKGNWGDILNEYLAQSHAEDGALKTDTVGAPQLKPNSVTAAALADGQVTSAKIANGAVGADQIQDGAIGTHQIADSSVTAVKLQGAGGANGIATLDSEGRLPESQVPERLGESQLSSTFAGVARTVFDQRAVRDLLRELTAATDAVPSGSGTTVTVGTAGAAVSQISGAITLSADSWPHVHFLNGPYASTTSLSRGYQKNAAQVPDTAYPGAAVEFVFDGDKIGLRVCNVIAGLTAYWVFVDGFAQSAAPVPITDNTGTAGELYELLLDFGSAKSRRIRVVIVAGYYGGLNGSAIYSVTRSGRARRRVATIGDSWVGGAASVPEMDLWINRLALATGWEVGRFGQGGTGYVNPGASPKVAYGNAARSAQVEAWKPDLIIVFGSLNDDAYSAATVGAAADALYADLATRLPDTPVVVIGPPRTNSAPPAGRLANRDALRAASADAPNVIGFIDQIGGTAATPAWSASTPYVKGGLYWHNSGVVYEALINYTSGASFSTGLSIPVTWFVGTGRVGATNGSGPTDRLVASDGNHLTSEGHAYFYRRVANALADVIRAYLAV